MKWVINLTIVGFFVSLVSGCATYPKYINCPAISLAIKFNNKGQVLFDEKDAIINDLRDPKCLNELNADRDVFVTKSYSNFIK